MDVWFVHSGGLEAHPASELESLRTRTDGFVWVDVADWDEAAERLVTKTLGAHALVVAACRRRNHVPTGHAYPDHVFVVLHAPFTGTEGHVHLLELDQLVGRRYLVTVHGPLNPAVDPDEALVETRGVKRRIEEGRFRPGSPAELSWALGSAIVRRQRELVNRVAERLPGLEAEAMAHDFRSPEELLERMFLVRHELVTARTMAAQSHDVYTRLASLDRMLPEPERERARDLAEQFGLLRSVAEGEGDFLLGVIELYRTRVTTRMTVAMERLAVIAAITLPITALASVYGMNIIFTGSTEVTHLLVVLLLMLSISGLLLRWTRKQGWW